MTRLPLAGGTFVFLASAASIDYRIQPSPETRFALEVAKTGLMSGKKHLFVFERYTGQLQYDKDKLSDSRVELEIEANSAVVKDTWIGEKDKKDVLKYALGDMLAAAQHPALKFVSTRVESVGPNLFKVFGTLEIRGIPKPAEVHVSINDTDGALGLEGTSAIKLSTWGIKPRSATLGLIGTKDEMKVLFTLRAVSSQ